MPEMSDSAMDNPQVTAEDVAWLAGIWDGEGTISVRRCVKINQFSPRISMVNTNPEIIRHTVDILTRLGMNPYLREKGQGGFPGSSKQCWIVSIETLGGSRKFLDTVAPLLRGKCAQADILNRFVTSRLTRRSQVTRQSDCPYNDEEFDALEALYIANGNQRGTSETIRRAPPDRRMKI